MVVDSGAESLGLGPVSTGEREVESVSRSARDLALDYLRAGLSVIPIAPDGSKSPLVSWQEFQTRLPTASEVEGWYGRWPDAGVAIICGKVSGNLLVHDFDADGFYAEWSEAVRSIAPDLLGKLPIVRTPKGYGHHVYARVPTAIPGEKLAKVPGANAKTPWQVAIETRGEAQYVLAPGCSPACHALGKEYEHISGPFIEEVPVITAEEIKTLLDVARALNRFVDSSAIVGGSPSVDVTGRRCWEEYRQRGSWEDLLEKHGWRRIKAKGEESMWQRPDKGGLGISATLGHCRTPEGERLFYCFSTNAAPLESGRCYNLFGALVSLEYGGDAKLAARRLLDEGYGSVAPDALVADVQKVIDEVRTDLAAGRPPVDIVASKKFEHLLESDRNFKRTWKREREGFCEDQLRYDAAILWFAIRAGWTLREMVSLIYIHRERAGQPPEKALDAKYVAQRVSWLSDSTLKKDTDAVASVASHDVVNQSADNIVTQIRVRTGIRDFLRLVQSGRDAEMYYVRHVDQRLTEIGTVEDLLSHKKFRESIVKRLDIFLPSMKAFEWEAIISLMLQTKEVLVEEDENHFEAFREVLETYVAGVQVVCGSRGESGIVGAVRYGSPFIDGDEFFLPLGPFRRWLDVALRNKGLTEGRVRGELKRLGFKSRMVHRGGRSRWYHAMPIEGPMAEVLREAIARADPRRPAEHAETNGDSVKV